MGPIWIGAHHRKKTRCLDTFTVLLQPHKSPWCLRKFGSYLPVNLLTSNFQQLLKLIQPKMPIGQTLRYHRTSGSRPGKGKWKVMEARILPGFFFLKFFFRNGQRFNGHWFQESLPLSSQFSVLYLLQLCTHPDLCVEIPPCFSWSRFTSL